MIIIKLGEIWRKHRRLVSPSFSERVALSYVTIFDRHSSDVTKTLKKMVNQEPFDIRPYINDCTLDAFVESTFSVDVDTELRKVFHRIMKLYERNSKYSAENCLHLNSFSFQRTIINRKTIFLAVVSIRLGSYWNHFYYLIVYSNLVWLSRCSSGCKLRNSLNI